MGISFRRVLISFMKILHDLLTSPRPHLLRVWPSGVRISIYEFGAEDTSIQIIALVVPRQEIRKGMGGAHTQRDEK